ncbi:hypothetical protein GCM10027051_11380 [Niabella terrae]
MLFLTSVIFGILYGWIGIYEATTANMNDTWTFHYMGIKESKLLFQHPQQYLLNLFQNPYGDGGLFSSAHSYWNNLKGNAFIKLLSVFDLFSLGNYYINIIFYCFLVFFATTALYRVFSAHFGRQSPWLLVGCFLIPSFVYWNNGIHKDGLCFLGLSLCIFSLYFYIRKGNFNAKGVGLLLGGALILFVFKNHLLMGLLPAALAWILSEKYPRRRWWIFGSVYLLAVIAFFGSRYLLPGWNLPAVFVEKQAAFNALKGGVTSLKVRALEPCLESFLQLLPQAVSLSMLRPYFSDIHKWLILPAYLEMLIIWLILLLAAIRSFRHNKMSPLGLFILFYSISVLLIIGYTVNNLGATVRYRSLLLPLFMPFLLMVIFGNRRLKIHNKNN